MLGVVSASTFTKLKSLREQKVRDFEGWWVGVRMCVVHCCKGMYDAEENLFESDERVVHSVLKYLDLIIVGRRFKTLRRYESKMIQSWGLVNLDRIHVKVGQ